MTTTQVKHKTKSGNSGSVIDQRIALARSLGLRRQVVLLGQEKMSLVAASHYEEVRIQAARDLLCPKRTIRVEANKDGCQYGRGFFVPGCGETEAHEHVEQKQIIASRVNRSETTALPMSALLRMKEARDLVTWSHWQIWRPETDDEEANRLADPWLVGVIGERYFKVCDWR